MKTIGYFGLLFLALLIICSCRENLIDYEPIIQTGDLYINSDPTGADIIFNDLLTGKITPDSLVNLQPGNYSITVRLLGIGEETTIVNVLPGQKKYVYIYLKLQ